MESVLIMSQNIALHHLLNIVNFLPYTFFFFWDTQYFTTVMLRWYITLYIRVLYDNMMGQCSIIIEVMITTQKLCYFTMWSIVFMINVSTNFEMCKCVCMRGIISLWWFSSKHFQEENLVFPDSYCTLHCNWV